MYSEQSKFTMVFKKKKKKLKHLLVKSICYKLLNTSCIFTFIAWNYGKCDQFQGCRLAPKNSLENGERSYCYICHVQVACHSDRIENIKKNADIINNFVEIKNDIQLCVDFDPLCEKFWMYHYKTSCRDPFGICRWKYYKNFFDTYNIFPKDD